MATNNDKEVTIMEQKKKCPYCGEEIMATAKKCKHCGEWCEAVMPVTGESNEAEDVNEEIEQLEEQSERPSIREKVCRYIGWAFYALAVLDFAFARIGNVGITGFAYSPVIFSVIGYLISRFGGNVSDEGDEL